MPLNTDDAVRDSVFLAVDSAAMEQTRPTLREWRDARWKRLQAALKVMGWDRAKFRKEIETELGIVVEQALWESWWKPSHDRYPDGQEVAEIAAFLGLSLEWMSGTKRWSREAINPNKAFSSAILNLARIHPDRFPKDPFDIPEPQLDAA